MADVFVDRANFLWPLKIMNSFAPAKSAEKKWHYEREEGLFIEWTTHLLTGVAAGYAATNDWKGALVGGVAALIPDIDEPRSHIGRPFFFISLPINRIFGHRTLTHSLIFVGIIGLVLYPFWNGYLALVAGLIAHILGDMITGKVKVLYPLKISIGLPVPRLGYLMIDRITRYGFGFLLLFVFWKRLVEMIT